MRSFSEEEINDFLNQYDFDVRKTHDARWIDQKCTMDVVCLVADCILEYTDRNCSKVFTVNDIWHNKYTVDNVLDIFAKPNPNNNATKEYDKYFGQPIKLLSYSMILNCTSYSGKNYYTIQNIDLLEYISFRNQNAFKFLCCYIEKVLRDSDIYTFFNCFFLNQNKDTFLKVKEKFSNFTIFNTPINGTVECNRIFTKVLNPLACKYKSLGTVRGNLSKDIITVDMISYNQKNWRDIYSQKPKGITRLDYNKTMHSNFHDKMALYNINKAKRFLRDYNNKYRGGLTEITSQKNHLKEKATQIHHIFPINLYPEIADFLENLISLTPSQHFSYAHPNNNTHYVDKMYQYCCLISKTSIIRENILNPALPTIYSFEDFIFVLNTGLETTDFNNIPNMDFNTIILYLDMFYHDDNDKTKESTSLYNINQKFGQKEVADN